MRLGLEVLGGRQQTCDGLRWRWAGGEAPRVTASVGMANATRCLIYVGDFENLKGDLENR
jgi:hypothetical protein